MPHYSAQDTDLFDEHTFGKMRDWLLEQTAVSGCPGCEGIVQTATDDDLLTFIEGDYPGGVACFLGDLETGNGELP